jgi:hypothetical protein
VRCVALRYRSIWRAGSCCSTGASSRRRRPGLRASWKWRSSDVTTILFHAVIWTTRPWYASTSDHLISGIARCAVTQRLMLSSADDQTKARAHGHR